jgi:putative PIN family toxin of toxin-antitoxin system
MPTLRLVLDTNVLVAALLTPGRTPDRALAAVFARGDVVLYDARMEAEYREVLARPKFRGIDPARVESLLAAVLAGAEDVGAVDRWDGAMTDADDRVFVEVALGGRADAVVTGNARHYPTELAFAVLSPAALLERLSGY